MMQNICKGWKKGWKMLDVWAMLCNIDISYNFVWQLCTFGRISNNASISCVVVRGGDAHKNEPLLLKAHRGPMPNGHTHVFYRIQ